MQGDFFGENRRGFVPLQTREERPIPLRISPLSNFLQPFAVLPHEAVAISQSGLYRALVAMPRLFVYRGVCSPLFCIYYSRWFAICQYLFQIFFKKVRFCLVGFRLIPLWGTVPLSRFCRAETHKLQMVEDFCGGYPRELSLTVIIIADCLLSVNTFFKLF